MAKVIGKKTTIVCMIILYLCAFFLIGAAIWLFTPVPEPQVYEINGTIESINIAPSRYKTVTIKVNGNSYTALDGANRAMDTNRIRKVNNGSAITLSYEVGTNEIRSLTINGEVFFTLQDYLREEHIYRVIIGVLVLPFGLIFSGLGIYIILQQRKRWNTNSNITLKT